MFFQVVIPAQAGIHFFLRVDARLKTSGMTNEEIDLWMLL